MPKRPGRNLPRVAALAAAALLVPAWGQAAPATSDDESPVTTTHEIRLEAGPLRYTAEAGRIALMDSARGVPRGFIFYVAYRVSAKHSVRPVTFVWNGGPGANSLRLHLEGLGPRRVTGSRVVDNDATLLSVTDLVFMDPIGTGFSRAATPADEGHFYGTLGDFAATAEFVSRWRAQHRATGTPVYLAGESFGSWRAAAVAERLGLQREPVAGIILISGGCPVGPLQPPETITALRVPAWAVTALHHGVLVAGAGADRDSILASARRWASERYAPALTRLATLPAAERDTIAEELAQRIGIAPDSIPRATLALTLRQYRESLLRGRHATLNLFDMRLTGPTPPLSSEPIMRYLREELGVRMSLPYRDLEPDTTAGYRIGSINQGWNYDTASAADIALAATGDGPPGPRPWVLGALEHNPGLRVFVAAARYDSFGRCSANEDLATRLPSEIAGRFTFRCYESGHMIGGDDEARPRLAADLRAFIAAPGLSSPPR
jgi:hypothetical protein